MVNKRKSVPEHNPLERFSLDQSQLNIEGRSRTSLLPWRGQFSPQFIEHIIEKVCPDSHVFLDPFCGSGTVLHETARRGHTSWGIEVNPAAWHLASLTSFAGLPTAKKLEIFQCVDEIASSSDFGRSAPLSFVGSPQVLLARIKNSSDDLARALAAVVILGMGNSTELNAENAAKGAVSVRTALSTLMKSHALTASILGDARCAPLLSETIDAVVTSPPYINVFNYHQNYRPAVELLGWKPLDSAQSEIGANRKHRSNRFLTVIQYCLDMSQCLAEMTRVMRTGAPLVIVLGRTSNVLGTPFRNGQLIQGLLRSMGGFGPVHCAERVFTSRYGERIFEDILITERLCKAPPPIEDARSLAVDALRHAAQDVPEKNRAALHQAIEGANSVRPSPFFKTTIPPEFRTTANFEKCQNAGS